MTTFAKEDLVLLCKDRSTVITHAALWKLKVPALWAIIGSISQEDINKITTQRVKRQKYQDWTVDKLQEYSKRLSIPYSGKTKGGIIDSILEEEITTDILNFQLDPDQLAVLQKWDTPELLISAGPGAGKTTLLTVLCSHILKHRPESRILILAFNRNAEKVSQARLKMFGVKSLDVKKITDISIKGCYVMTFDKYGYYSRSRVYDQGFNNVGYRMALETASEHPVQEHEHWDWLIVDEAQDIKSVHVSIIDSLRKVSKHFVVAGDPRQELYIGAVWFSQLWTSTPEDKRSYLRYNHRSSPNIVNFLNRFSKEHFPTLHHDQIPTRNDEGKVHFEIVKNDVVGDHVGKLMLNHKSGEVFSISPVSIKKYNSENIINSIRQVVYEAQFGGTVSGNITVLDEQENNTLDSNSFIIGNSYRLKGTERKIVIVFLADIPYQEYGGIPLSTSLKLIFVALSRAREHLHIILTDKPTTESVFASLVPENIPLSTTVSVKKQLPLFHLKVKDDMVNLECWTQPNMTRIGRFVPLTISISSDHDFVGIFAETHLASSLGLQVKNITNIRLAQTRSGVIIEPVGVFQSDTSDEYEAVVDGRLQDGLTEKLEDLKSIIGSHPEYIFSVIQMSSSIGKIWTVSERLRNEIPSKDQLSPIAQFIRNYIGINVIHNKRVKLKIIAHRSLLQVGELHGELDFSGQNVVEIKHAELDNISKHGIQLAIYGAMTGHKNCVLVNTKYGQAFKVLSFTTWDVSNVSRALLALKHGTSVGVQLKYRIPLTPQTEVYISVDIETVLINNTTFITEIGAVAFIAGSDRIISVFHQLNDGVITDVTSNDPYAQLTGLRVTDIQEVIACSSLMVMSFRLWYTQVSKKRVFITWAGSDATLLQCHDSPNIDAYRIYCIWLEKIGQKRDTNKTLSCAVAQILGPNELFVAHRAFEDACMTAAVFTAITTMEGTL
jgi:hypothetical protein